MAIELPFDPFALNRPTDWDPSLEIANRLPILVTGVAGVVGFNAFHFLQQKYPGQVIGIRPTSNWRLSGEGIIGLDPEDEPSLRQLVEKYNFRSVLSCGGSCALKSCELDPAMAQRVNVDSVTSLINSIRSADVRLVHLSIDLVYSGNGSGDYIESDPTDPVTVYGTTMIQTENIIVATKPDAAILRISLPMGISFNGHAGAIDWIQSRFSKGRPATLYFDEIRTPTYSQCMNFLIEELLGNRLSGLFHAGGPTKLSLYQIAQIVNLVGGYDPDLLQGCYRLEAGPMPPRAGDVTMNSEKLARAIGKAPFLPWPYQSELIPTDIKWHYDRSVLPDAHPNKIAELLYCVPGAFIAS